MPPETNPFAIEPQTPGFEALAQENGFRFWWASDLATLLGYADLASFKKAVSKAMQVCIQLEVDVTDNIVPHRRVIGEQSYEDFKLSRFACYLAAMNGDVRKPEVAQAQAYFITFAEACRLAIESEGVERVAIRGDITSREKGLGAVAKEAGVYDYARFQGAGYRGLYNMNFAELKALKGVPVKRSPLDFMGKTELAANLFRITQTEQRLKNDQIQGQDRCEDTALAVGRRVRQAMIETGGTRPEDLPAAGDIRGVHKQIKGTHRGFKKLDGAARAEIAPLAIDTEAESVSEDE
jgi:DNA-damage-inducible protein D